VLFVDTFGLEGMIRAARLARAAQIPVVADFERGAGPKFSELLGLVDHLILSQTFAQKLTGASDAATAVKLLWTAERKVVAVTCGAEGCCYLSAGAEMRHQPAFKVKAVDTTGCGDVFHGAYASTLARGLSLADRIRFASAAAALKTTQPGGQAGIPTRVRVEEFLQTHSTRL
jgi:sulfofructose kinase